MLPLFGVAERRANEPGAGLGTLRTLPLLGPAIAEPGAASVLPDEAPSVPAPPGAGSTGRQLLDVACACEQSVRNVESEACSADDHCALELRKTRSL
jgi:hypothetical protein